MIKTLSQSELKTQERGSGVSDAWSFVFKVFVLSRLFYLLAGMLLVGVMQLHPFQRRTSDVPFGALNLWAHFDGEHYATVAGSGYLGTAQEASPAFFPLYPMMMRSIAELGGGPISLGGLSVWGVLISLAALLPALWFVYRITEETWGKQAAKGAVLTLAFFPTTFFLNAVYTESLFLMLSSGAVWAVRIRRDLLLGCLFAAFATATRNVGVLLLIPLFYEWWRNRGEYNWRVMYLAIAPSGLILYMVWLWRQFGDPLLFLSEQAKWQRGFTGPLNTLMDAFALATKDLLSLFDPATYKAFDFSELLRVLATTDDLYNLGFLIFAYVMLSLGVRWLSADLVLYGFALVLVPVFFETPLSPLMSMPRFVLVAFPLFIVLGIVLKDRRLLAGWAIGSAVISLAFCALFVNWHFVA